MGTRAFTYYHIIHTVSPDLTDHWAEASRIRDPPQNSLPFLEISALVTGATRVSDTAGRNELNG